MKYPRFFRLLRQVTYPPAFRIAAMPIWDESLSELKVLTELIETLNEDSKPQEVNESLAQGLCNEHFRLMRTLSKLERGDKPPREARRLRATLEEMLQLFDQYGFTYQDISGQDWHPNRMDFEQFAEADIDPTLTRSKIRVCERPAVFLNERLIQTAKGIVARPA